jgi:acetyl/propionyl-CoA carboxylase alpha subunit
MAIQRFKKILIANRGEIALRIMRTCRSMGIASVAVYSDADRTSPHVKFADEAINIGAAPPADSYLNIERVLSAARQAEADAIHPGYGFLSEHAGFARECGEHRIVFIGPAPETIRKMGDKIEARSAASSAGLPVLPGYDGEDQSAPALRDAMLALQLPVMIKAAAGGGGRGMRVVRVATDIDSAISSAAREASRAFGNGRLFIEKLVEDARHVEVQILGDQYGNLVHLFERDCSVQRRHQKVIEESPAPGLTPALRQQLCDMAMTLGRAIGYSNAGTVEFLISRNQTPFFIEVNSRLQVEHAVTEMVTGLDLVRLQIEIAEGRPLHFKQEEIVIRGHAFEARLYAEDPSREFLPTTGPIGRWSLTDAIEGVRVDAGVEAGCEVGTSYDGLLAKVIAHRSDRTDALRGLVYALKGSRIQGLVTNRAFLLRLLEHPAFAAGEVNTSLIESQLESLVAPPDSREIDLASAAIAVHLSQSWRADEARLARLPLAYRNNPYRLPSIELEACGEIIEVSWSESGKNQLEIIARSSKMRVQIVTCAARELRLEIDGTQRTFQVLARR